MRIASCDLPVERDGDGTEPRAETCAQGTTPNRVGGTGDSPNFIPDRSIQTVCVDQCRRRQNGHMGCTEDRLGIVGCQRSAEENKEDRQNRGGQNEGQSEREQSGLDCVSVWNLYMQV